VVTSDWVTITQSQINQFAQATGDHQWIHVDVERATAGPFGAPIAHGFLTLSLIPTFLESALRVEQSGLVVNYGLNKVRFIAPVRVNNRLRARFTLAQVDSIDKGGVQLTWDVTLECEGAAKPVCAAQSLVRLYP
jgi:acyl dehydratase